MNVTSKWSNNLTAF